MGKQNIRLHTYTLATINNRVPTKIKPLVILVLASGAEVIFERYCRNKMFSLASTATEQN